MYKEFDSIFHEETIIYEYKQDIDDNYTRRISNERSSNKHDGTSKALERSRKYNEKAQGGSNGYRMDKNIVKMDTSDYPSHLKTGSKEEQKEHDKVRDRIRSGMTPDKGAGNSNDRKRARKAKNESSLFLDFDLI